jgi:hypothetical protein
MTLEDEMSAEYEVIDTITGKKWKTQEQYHKEMLDGGYIKEDGFPLKCFRCDSINLEFKVKDTMNGIVSEEEVLCKDCKSPVAYWSYGYWEM